MTHAMLAGISKAPEWAIDHAEADMLAKATSDVMRHYDIPGADQKTLDWLGLLYAAGMVYGTRLISTAKKKPVADTKPAPVAPSELRPATNANGMTTANIPGVGKVEVPVQ